MVRIGVTLPQFTDDRDRFIDGARRAEALGFDSVWVFDHLWPLGNKRRPLFEAWSSLAHLAAATDRVGIGTLVTRSSLRHPAVLGKMVATVGEIASGRLICALGSGDALSRAENEAFGLPFFEGRDRANELVSTVEVVTAYTNEGLVDRTDGFVHIRRLPASPRRGPPPAIWVGGWARAILRLAGEGADGWNGWGATPERFAQAAAVVTGAAGGRAVELSWGGQVLLADDDEKAENKLAGRNPQAFVTGGPGTVATGLKAFADAGATHLIVAFPGADTPDHYELFAETVTPAVRVG